MRLEGSYSYQLVRALRVVLPFVVLVLIAIPAWRYWNPLVEETPVVPPPPQLVEDVEELMEGFRLSQDEGGRTAFLIEARIQIGFLDGKNLLEDVKVTIYDEDPASPPREIFSDRCSYDQETEDILFEGNVEILFDSETSGRTQALAYNNREGTIRSTAPAEITRSGQFTGSAERMSFNTKNKVFGLDGGVRVAMSDGTVLESGAARYNSQSSFVTASQGLRVSFANGSVVGREGRADLDPDTQAVDHVRVDGALFAQSTNPESLGTLAAESLMLDVRNGRVRRADASGVVALASPSEGDLTGERIEGLFGEEGELQVVTASGSATMLFGSGRRLESSTIRNDLSGVVTTSEDSRLILDTMTATGSHFVIERGDVIEFRTEQPAVIEAPRGRSAGMQTQASFDAASGELVSLRQTGAVAFDLENRHGTAEAVEIGTDGQVVLTGDTVVEDDALRVEARRITLDQDGDSFRAEGDVKTVYVDALDPVLVLANRARGADGRVVFSDEAQLWQASTHVQADTIEVYPDTRSFAAITDVRSTMEDTRVWAQRLDFDDQSGVITYAGGVRVRADDMELSAGELRVTLAAGDPDRVVATGDVEVRGDVFEGTGEQAVYVRSESTVTLTGKDAVVIDPSRGTLRGQRLVIDVEAGDVYADGDSSGRVISTRKLGSDR